MSGPLGMMNTPVGQHQLALLHAHLQAGGGLSLPFAEEIFLIETHVAGTSHVPIREIERGISIGDSLVLRREQDNPHDSLAILILTEKGEKLGYVPRDRNEILARLMDAGKFLFARLESKEWHGDWLRVAARVFLRDV
jgi:HIRAN domain